MKFDLSRFERKSSQRFIPEIDALRFFAILPVMLVHFSGALLTHNTSFDRTLIDNENFFRKILLQGNVGVFLFFGISGFILALPFLKAPKGNVNLKQYFIRRLVRIEPPYLIAITLFLLVHIVLGQQTISFLFERYIASFFYVHNIWFDDRSYILPVAWSLEIEVQFYLLMPFIMLFIRFRESYIWRGVIYVLLLLCSYFVTLTTEVTLNYFMHYFVAGMIAADLYLNYKFKRSHLWDVIFIVSLIVLYVTPHKMTRSLSCFAVILSSFHVVYFKKMLNTKLITIIGGMCYSIYLLHYPLYHLMMKLVTNTFTIANSFELTYIVQGIVLIPISVVLMSIYFLLVEKPFMVMSQNLAKKMKKNK